MAATTSVKPEEEAPRQAPDQPGGFMVVGGPVRRPWREGTLTRAAEIGYLSDWIVRRYRRNPQDDRADDVEVLVAGIQCHLAAVREAAAGPHHFVRDGPRIERAISNLDAAEASLLQIAPEEFLLGQMPALLHHVQRHLPRGDPRRGEMERIARRAGVSGHTHPSPPSNGTKTDKRKEAVAGERQTIVAAVRGASSAALREQTRVRSFRSVVVAMTGVMLAVAIALGVMAWRSPTMIPLCFEPTTGDETTVVCPTGESDPVPTPGSGTPSQDVDDLIADTVSRSDMMLVEIVGAAAATVAAAAAIRRIRGSSEPYAVPVALALLKLPTGAMTAVLGLLLMRGEFIPGLSALDSSGQILSWAIVFGYAQQLFTRFVDQQGDTVLDQVRGGPASPAHSTPGGD